MVTPSTEYLLTDPDFLAFCAVWKTGWRCPLGLGDWLRDRGLDALGRGADWAATVPDRLTGRETVPQVGPTPFWWTQTGAGWRRGGVSPHSLPARIFDRLLDVPITAIVSHSESFAAAVLDLLRAFP